MRKLLFLLPLSFATISAEVPTTNKPLMTNDDLIQNAKDRDAARRAAQDKQLKNRQKTGTERSRFQEGSTINVNNSQTITAPKVTTPQVTPTYVKPTHVTPPAVNAPSTLK